MKKTFLYVLIFCCTFCNGSTASGQALGFFDDWRFIDSCDHYYSSAIIRLSTFAHLASTKIATNHGDGIIDTAQVYAGLISPFTWGGLGAWSNHVYASPGFYTVKKILFEQGGFQDSISTSIIAGGCSFITGHVYHDADANCSYNPLVDPPLGRPVDIRVDSAGTPVATFTTLGFWAYPIKAGAATSYTFTVLPGFSSSYSLACPSSGARTYAFNPSTTTLPTQDFGFNCISSAAYDLGLTFARVLRASTSGGNSYITLYVKNLNCNAPNATVTLEVSPKYTINAAGISPAPTSVIGQTITWNLGTPSAGTTPLYIPLTPLGTTSIGDTACTYASISPTAGDLDAENNVISVCDSVRSSWDPNHMSVLPERGFIRDSILTYTVQFENLGNDTAFNIRVMDTLSTALEPASIQLLSTTHPMYQKIHPAGDSIAEFCFNNIRLNGKHDSVRNKGAFTFSIRTKPGLSTGNTIANKASIYFDGNPAIETNRAYYAIEALGVPNTLADKTVEIFPNPASNTLHVRVITNKSCMVSLRNTMGQELMSMSARHGDNVLSIKDLLPGVYYLQVSGDAVHFSKKIVKQ